MDLDKDDKSDCHKGLSMFIYGLRSALFDLPSALIIIPKKVLTFDS